MDEHVTNDTVGAKSMQATGEEAAGRRPTRPTLGKVGASSLESFRKNSLNNLFRSHSRNEIEEPVKAASQALTPDPKYSSASLLPKGKSTKVEIAGAFSLHEVRSTSPKHSCDLDVVAVHSLGELPSSSETLKYPFLANPDASKENKKQDPSKRADDIRMTDEAVFPVSKSPAFLVPEIVTHQLQTSRLRQEARGLAEDSGKVPNPKEAKLLDRRASVQDLANNESYQNRKRRWLVDADTLSLDLSNARILLFEYPEPPDEGKRTPLANVTLELRNRLLSARQDFPTRPIMFIGHDFGATIIEKSLMECAKDPSLVVSICKVTIGVVFLWTPPEANQKVKQELQYFELREPRLAWGVKSSGKDSSCKRAPPYAEIDPNDKDKFLNQHLENFRNLYDWLAELRPAMALQALPTDGAEVYMRVLNSITDSLNIYRVLDAADDRKGDKIKSLLNFYHNADLQDSAGQSALHLAVRQNHVQVVKVLLDDYGANPSIQDLKSRNALHYAARYHPNKPTLVQELVAGGVDLDALDSAGVSARKAARLAGVSASLLKKQPVIKGPFEEVTSDKKDPSPPQSDSGKMACHECRATLAEFYKINGQEQFTVQRPSIYELLYENGSGPKEILEGARDYKVEVNPQCKWYHLPANHTGWVDDLFAKMKLTTEQIRNDQHEGTMYWSRYMRPQARVFKNVRQSIEQPSTHIDRSYTGKDFVLFIPFLNFERRCDLLSICRTINRTQREDADKRWEERFTKWLARWREVRKSDGSLETFDLKDDASNDEPEMQPSVTSCKTSIAESTNADIMPTWNPDQAKAYATPLNADTGDTKESDPLEVERNLIMGYLMDKSATLHIRRTLDQSHYFMLQDTSDRDKDQVVLRRARDSSLDTTVGYDDSETNPLVMVDQLWLWVVGDVVISSFPQKWMQADWQRDSDVLDQILQHLRLDKKRAPILTAHDLANLIVSYCVGIFNRPLSKTGLQLHDLFEASVGLVADGQTKMFQKFEADSKKNLMKLYENKRQHGVLDKIFAIKEEIKLLDEIKDIRDEINMILHILTSQALAVGEMTSIMQPVNTNMELLSPRSPQRQNLNTQSGDTPFEQPHQIVTKITEGSTTAPTRSDEITAAYKARHPIIDANIRDFTRMLNHANASYEELNQLLDLKQKQANFWEARLARVGAESSARQGSTILVFTVATIVFGSLSFVTAFFALNVTAYPHQGDLTTWQLGHIVGYVAAISIGLSLPFIFLAFNINFLVEMVIKILRLIGRIFQINSTKDNNDEHSEDYKDTDDVGNDKDGSDTSSQSSENKISLSRQFHNLTQEWITSRRIRSKSGYGQDGDDWEVEKMAETTPSRSSTFSSVARIRDSLVKRLRMSTTSRDKPSLRSSSEDPKT